jgi:hypothetical protein
LPGGADVSVAKPIIVLWRFSDDIKRRGEPFVNGLPGLSPPFNGGGK